MMNFSNILDKVSGLRLIFEKLKFNSNLGRDLLLSESYKNTKKQIDSEINNISKLQNIILNHKNSKKIDYLKNLISQSKDIYTTINNIKTSQTLDDIELFEIKHLALLSIDISKLVEDLEIVFISIAPLDKLAKLLDPDNQRIAHFYIYSSYSSKLLELRKKLNHYQLKDSHEKAEHYRLLALEEENKIRTYLSKKIQAFSNDLKTNLDNIAKLDLTIAKTVLAIENNFCKPMISDNKTIYKALFNPQVKEILESNNKKFQPIDVNFDNKTVLITGANMTGKTVLLKTLALSQYLFQFGFFVPAKQAAIVPVDKIMVNIEENHSEISGLSSYANEILNVNKIIIASKQQENILVLIDELARTTNPSEGKAIVSACVEILLKNNIKSFITTHYSGIEINCRKLKVKGLKKISKTQKINLNNINEFIDYSLVETNNDEVPTEALKIAEILEVDSEFINLAKKHFNN